MSGEHDKIAYLAGTKLPTVKSTVPYSEAACAFLNALSAQLRAIPQVEAYPDIMAFAFWCRKGNLLRLKQNFVSPHLRLGQGLVFHIAPSNVPINFAFSYAFGLLAGNANIVRVPSRGFAQVDLVLAAIERLFAREEYADIASGSAFVRYDRDTDLTAEFSAHCDVRIIWGGDRTIDMVRACKMMPRSKELTFADRYSLCILDAEAVLSAEPEAVRRLAEGFYNDTYLSDQQACSSPQLILWQGQEVEQARTRFWQAVDEAAHKYDLAPVKAVDKYLTLCGNAIDFATGQLEKQDNLLYHVMLQKLSENLDQLRGRYGLFYEYVIRDGNLSDLAPFITKKYQTLTYFGIDKEILAAFALHHGLNGIDRIVPVGSAMDIGIIWDGYDLIGELSRIIQVV